MRILDPWESSSLVATGLQVTVRKEYYDFISIFNQKDSYLHGMKRAILFIAIVMSACMTRAQSGPSLFSTPSRAADTSNHHSKWFVTRYTGVSTGFVAFKGGGGSYLSAPMALQLNRQLTNNLFAFGNISATPTLFHSNSIFFSQPAMAGKSYGPVRANNTNFGIYPAAQIGLMYMNNDKTFSISGSVSVSRSNYYGYSPLYGPSNVFVQ
ncbi:hypothetical protein [Chitinophaga sp.]|uniref:hypothetical protein n=1 Tax=Chitinophaga sp. TaxID=1869181 RepID=UPI0031D30D13